MTEPTDSLGHAADPYREPYEPPPFHPADTGATDLLDFPPMPPYPEPPFPQSAYPQTDYPQPPYPQAPYPQAPHPQAPHLDPDAPFARPDRFPEPPRPAQPARPPEPEPTAAPGLRLASTAEATARLRIKLPDALPQPSTTLRPHAAWEDVDEAATPEGAPRPHRSGPETMPFAQVAASPARPSALPSELAALTTATLVVPLPPDTRPTAALLTTTLPPDSAAQANAALLEDGFHDTFEQVFGVDLASASAADVGIDRQPATGARSGGGRPAEAGDVLGEWFREEGGTAPAAEPDQAFVFTDPASDSMDQAPYEQVPYEYVPGAVAVAAFGGPYGAPTHPAPFPGVAANDPDAHDRLRHALALRYLGGIFHDSSGEASYLDPRTIRGRVPELGGAAAAAGLTDAAFPDADATRTAPPQAEPDAPTEQLIRIPSPAGPADSAPPKRAAAAHGRAARPAAPRSARHAGDAQAAGRGLGGKLLTALVILVGVFALVYGLALVVAGGVFGGTVPRGTVVGGVPIGGLSSAAAERALGSGLGPLSHAPLRLMLGQDSATLDPARSGLSLDAAATVEAAQAQRTNPLVVIPALFGFGHRVAPVASVDSAALSRALAGVSASHNSPMVEGRIAFHASLPVVTAAREGREFSVIGAVAAVRSAYLRLDGPVVIPVNALHPKATPAALQDALEHLARPAVAGPIALVTGTVTRQLTPDRISDAVVIEPDDTGRMVARVDGAKLRGDLDPAALVQETAPVNASFTLASGGPELVPGRDGRGFPPDALAAAVRAVLAQPVPRTATVPLGDLAPAFTTADAQALGVTDVLGTATVPVPSAPNRFANVQRATGLVAGSIVGPGETWSFLKTLGPLDTAHGFDLSSAAQKAGVDLSGGVDTVATAVFGAAFASGMGDTVHHAHASYVDRYPVGLDAAVVAPGTDMQWTNTGDHPVYLYASYANDSLAVALLGQKAYDQVSVQVSQRYAVVQDSAGCAASGAAPGFQVDVSRTLTRGGSNVGGEQFHVQYASQYGSGCPSGGSGGAPSSAAGSPSSSGSGSASGPPGGDVPGSAAPPSPSPSPSGLLGGLLH